MPTAMIRNAGIVQCLFLVGSFYAMGSTSAFPSPPPTLTASRRHYGTPVSSPKIIAALVALQAEKEPSTTEPTTNTEKKTTSPPNMFFSTAVEATPKQQQKATPQKEDSGGDLIPTNNNSNNNELLEMFLDVSGKIAKDMFVVLRKTAATALTSSLPVEEQQELLERTLGTQRVPQKQKPAKNNVDDDEEDYYNNRPTLSVKENVAAAVVQQVQRERPAVWEQEKVALLQQAEQAAQERVATELAIQRQRMEMEKQLLQQQTKNAQLQLQEKTKALQALKLQQEQQQQQQQQQLVEQQTLSSGRTEETETESVVNEQEDKLAALQQELDQKESQAKQDQEMIEQLTQQLEELKAAAAASTETQTQDEDSPTSSSSSSSSSSIAAPTTTTKDEKPRIHAGRYTAAEYRALTEEEKEMVKALREKEGITESVQSTEDDEVESDNTLHPVLGPVIQDLGYKRIHLVSAGRLGTIPIWKKQRIYRHERAKAMVNDKWKTMHLGLLGIICLHEDPEGKLAIIDGQHRVGMMMLLRDKQRRELENAPTGLDVKNAIDFDRVLVEVYPQNDSDDAKHAQELFAEINKAEPLKLVDMPGVAKARDRNIITDAVDQLYNRYPSMFSPSQRCRVPNVNVDNLRNSLFGANVMKTHDLTTSKKLLDWMLEQNELLASKYEDNEEAQKVVSPKAWKKASDNGFYLGLESSWLYK